MLKRRKKILIVLSVLVTLCVVGLVFTGCDSGNSNTGSSIADRFDYDAAETVPSDTADIAVLQGTWYEMGYQLGEQYKDEVMAATAFNVAAQIEGWGSYEAALDAYVPYLKLADEYFVHEKDGSLRDMIQGCADATGMTFEDTMMMFISADSEIEPSGRQDTEGETKGEDQKDCSATMIWGDATATDEPGCIGSMKADIGYGDLNFAPTMLMFPDNGNAFISTHGVFGSVANEKGFMVQSPGGSVIDTEEVYRIGIYPLMYLAAYCDTTQDAIDILGDPETTPRDEWWPATTDFNFVMGDAEGNACVFEIAGSERNIRYNGETKYLGRTEAGDAIIPNETSDYLCAANFYMSENMLFTSRANPQAGLDEGWPDPIVRYWSLEKVIQDAVADGGADADTLRQAMSCSKYYIPEGWNYDSFPAYGYYGAFVPDEIYEGFESGETSRADYYGELYDPESWGKAMSVEDSRNAAEWCTGWHENNEKGAWTWNLDTCYWSPEPFAPDTKTGLINIYDSNEKTMYIMKGSDNRALSNIPNSTGTYAAIAFADKETAEMYGGDSVKAMLTGMQYEMEEQLWFAARDISENNVSLESARADYLEKAKELTYSAQNLANLGYISENVNEKSSYYAQAMSKYVEAQCYAKMAQDNPQTLNKDYGKYEPTEK